MLTLEFWKQFVIRPYCVSTLYYSLFSAKVKKEGGGGWKTTEGKGGLSERTKYGSGGRKEQVKEKAVEPGI